MTKKDKNHDLTRIEDLSEFLHPEDSTEVDNLFSDANEAADEENSPLPPPFELDFQEEEEEEEENTTDATEENNDQDTALDFDFSNEDEESAPFSTFVNDEEDQDNLSLENEFNSDFQDTEDHDFESSFDTSDLDDAQEEQLDLGPNEDIKDYSASTITIQSSQEEEEEEEEEDQLHAQQASEHIPKERENFKDIKEFAKNATYGEVQNGGNPAFSIILKNIESKSAHESIISTLSEHNLIGDNESIYRQSLELGSLLIAHISEYSAVYLASKLRKYSHDIQVGLSEDIHPSKSYKSDNKGLTTKRSIFQNKDKSYKKSQQKFEIEDMVISKQSQVINSNIVEHLGVVSISDTFSLSQLTNNEDEVDNIQTSSEIYELLTHKLSCIAFEKGANALLSVSHSLAPLIQQSDDEEILYQVICTADAVIIEKSK